MKSTVLAIEYLLSGNCMEIVIYQFIHGVLANQMGETLV